MDQEKSKEIIISHYRDRSYEKELDPPRLEGHMINRSCGDELTLFTRIEDDTVQELSYKGRGCSICIASADILCKELQGKPVARARETAEAFLQSLDPATDNTEDLPGDIPALLTLKKFPMRQKCATMGWKILLDITE